MTPEYTSGFMDKCAYYGVDPVELIKLAMIGTTRGNQLFNLYDRLSDVQKLMTPEGKHMLEGLAMKARLTSGAAPKGKAGYQAKNVLKVKKIVKKLEGMRDAGQLETMV